MVPEPCCLMRDPKPFHIRLSGLKYANGEYVGFGIFKSLRLRPPTPEAYGKTADFGTLCIPGSDETPAPHFCPRATAAGSLH